MRALEEKSPVCEHRAGIMPGICIRMLEHHGLVTPGEICSLADYAGVFVCVQEKERKSEGERAHVRERWSI